MSAIILDIETAGERWANIDDQTQALLIKRIGDRQKCSVEEATEVAQNELGLNPYTAEIVAFGILDVETDKGAVYFQAGSSKVEDWEAAGIRYKTMTETELLQKFWELSARYTHFVTFSGRTFDIPFIMIRSAVRGIRPPKDLMRNRYLNQQFDSAKHVDLYDQLTFYGSFVNRIGGLHLACRAFGIETPKDGELDGSKVGEYYQKGKYRDIAEYNGRDLRATRDLYLKWRELLAN